jgi:putative chitinase
VDLEGNPALAAEPVLSLRIACEFWTRKKINGPVGRDDVVQVTQIINGGQTGIEDRRALTGKAKAALARIEGLQLSGTQATTARAVLHRGAMGEDVAALQRLLRAADFALAVDAEFGPATEVSVARFQSDHGLTANGVVGAETWAALEAAAQPVARVAARG